MEYLLPVRIILRGNLLIMSPVVFQLYPFDFLNPLDPLFLLVLSSKKDFLFLLLIELVDTQTTIR